VGPFPPADKTKVILVEMILPSFRLSFVLSVLSLLILGMALTVPPQIARDNVRAAPPSRSLDKPTRSNGDRMARGLPPAKPKRLYDSSEYTIFGTVRLLTSDLDAPRMQPRAS
jgi:hypothetical protein